MRYEMTTDEIAKSSYAFENGGLLTLVILAKEQVRTEEDGSSIETDKREAPDRGKYEQG